LARRAVSDPSEEEVLLEVLRRGQLEIVGRLVEASNATLYATACADGVSAGCVYKPIAGERPLWDFPARTLARRETAAFVLCRRMGWRVVPPTVFREGPFGPGSVQWWVEGRGEPAEPGVPVSGEPGAGLIDVLAPDDVPAGWLRVLDAQDVIGRRVVLAHADDGDLQRMAVLDAVANNTDRKGGHVLRHRDGAVYGVDHGLTFSTEDKLRTVLWGWAGLPLPEQHREVLARVSAELSGRGRLYRDLSRLLARAEVDRTAERVAGLVSSGRFPRPRGGRPSIPWPAF
jgi:uncharacterized repeat protein (TIGR03843 family)